MRFILVNSNPSTVRAFETCFANVSRHVSGVTLMAAEASLGGFLARYEHLGKTAVVSPANSFSFMGSGFDRGIAEQLASDYKSFEQLIQRHACQTYRGYMPPLSVNVLTLADAGLCHSAIDAVIQVPTMVVPEQISYETVFNCMWMLLAAAPKDFHTILLPALGAGYGGVDPIVAARTMAAAIGLYYREMEPTKKAAAIMRFLRKDPRGLGEDASSITAHYKNDSGENGPVDWDALITSLR